eukprot:g42683.t1
MRQQFVSEAVLDLQARSCHLFVFSQFNFTHQRQKFVSQAALDLQARSCHVPNKKYPSDNPLRLPPQCKIWAFSVPMMAQTYSSPTPLQHQSLFRKFFHGETTHQAG